MGCNSCKYLKTKEKKEAVLGASYYCSKYHKYVLGNNVCDIYSYDYNKTTLEKNEIYKDGVKYSNDKTEVGTYIFILIILITLGLIFNVK